MSTPLGNIDPDLRLAARLRGIAGVLEQNPHLDGHRDCGCLRCRAHTYAAQGYPSHTLGDGGSRGSDTTSSTERAALATPIFAALGSNFEIALGALGIQLAIVENLTATVMAHASDDDPIPAGQGPCVVSTCDHVCNPRKNQDDVRRKGLCPACHQSMLRYLRRNTGHTRQQFIAWRAKALTSDRTNPKLQVVAESVG